MTTNSLQLLKITRVTDEGFRKSSGKPYQLMLNPETMNWDRSIPQNQPASPILAAGSGDRLRFDIILDCTGIVDPARTDMFVEIAALERVLFRYEAETRSPNFIKIQWGKKLVFKGIITLYNTQYTLFRTDGSPLRAKINLGFSTYAPSGILAKPVQPSTVDFNAFENLYRLFGDIQLSGVSSEEMKYILFQKVLNASSTGNWNILSDQHIWSELTWEFCTKKGLPREAFIRDIEAVKNYLPPSLKASWLLFTGNQTIPGIPVNIAGLVLLSGYIPLLFDRLGLTDNNGFLSRDAQLNALNYLYYLASGSSNAEQTQLNLSKVLCGVAQTDPVNTHLEVPEEHQTIIEGLLNAAILHWPAIGSSSIDGFRGNWLIREGVLSELEDRWQLTVTKRAYDVLIEKSGFSFSIIYFPWMRKPLHTIWR